MNPMIVAALLGLLVATPAAADICKYIDAEGNNHYSDLAPQHDWTKLSCISADDDAGKTEAAWRTARTKIKIGMTDSQLRAADPLLRYVSKRRVLESATGRDEWLRYPEFEVQLHNGRVVAISY